MWFLLTLSGACRFRGSLPSCFANHRTRDQVATFPRCGTAMQNPALSRSCLPVSSPSDNGLISITPSSCKSTNVIA